MKKVLNMLILTLIMAILLGAKVNAAANEVYNIVTCPGENMATQMQINWQSSIDITDLKVEYTVEGDEEFLKSQIIEGAYHQFSRADKSSEYKGTYVGFSTPRNVWNATLNNLLPQTKYLYRIINESKVYSDVYSFYTGSLNDDEFSFLFMTDPQYYEENGASKFNKMTEDHIIKNNIKFSLITGDISDKGGNSNYWDMFYTKSSLMKVPFVTTVGNHEYYDSGTTTTDNTIYNQFFNNPQNGPDSVKGSSYYFIYNNALFIMLDSEASSSYLQQQKKWFKNVCSSVKSSYIIVGTHRSAYAGAHYVADGKNFIANWGEVFDECQVDLVLSGHDHIYSRTKKLIDGEVTTEKYKGTTYILGGTAGNKVYSKSSDENLSKWDNYFDNITCSTVITLGKEYLTTATYSYDGEILDSCKIERKRFGTIDESFTKKEFEKTFEINTSSNDLTSGTIKWNNNGYGYVKSISFKNINNNKDLGTVTVINNMISSLSIKKSFLIGEINKIQIDILYEDNSNSTIYCELDNTINWGEIISATVSNVTDTSFNLILNVNFNEQYEYISRIKITENGQIVKNFFIKKEHLTLNELVIEAKNVLESEESYNFLVEAININGNAVWSQEISFTAKKTYSDEEIYQNEMANLAFKAMIDNLLKAIKK